MIQIVNTENENIELLNDHHHSTDLDNVNPINWIWLVKKVSNIVILVFNNRQISLKYLEQID